MKKLLLALTLLSTAGVRAQSPWIWGSSDYSKNLPNLGLEFKDGKRILTLTADPSAGGGLAAPVGTVGLRANGTSGEVWVKTGAADTAWTQSTTASLPLSLANGGAGESMAETTVAAPGTYIALSPTTGVIRLTGTGFYVIQGIVSDGTAKEITFINAATQTLLFAHQAGSASATNRIINPNGTDILLASGSQAKAQYDTVTQRWRITSVAGFASTTNDGLLSGSAYTTFATKIGGLGTQYQIPYFSSTAAISSSANIKTDSNLNRIGVGLGSDTIEAVVHVQSDSAQTVNAATGFSATLTQFVLPDEPASASFTAVTPSLATPAGSSATPNYTGSGYVANGDTIQYRITPCNVGDAKCGVGTYVASSTDDGSTSAYSVDISIATPTENVTPDEWVIERNINGGGYNDYQVVSSTSFSDTNSGWVGGAPPGGATYDDFLASGQSYTIDIYGTKVSPIATIIKSINPYNSSGYTANNDGSTFRLQFSITGGDSPFLVKWDATNHFNILNGNAIGTSDILSGAPTVTPNTYGYQANGSVLNISYDYYANTTIGGSTVWASGALNSTTVDPNNGLYYYNVLSGFDPITGKVIKDSTDGKDVTTGATFYDDGITVFGDGVTITPTSYYISPIFAEAHGGLDSDAATMSLKSLDGDYNRIELKNSTDLVQGYLKSDSGVITLRNGSAGPAFNIAASSASLNTNFNLGGALIMGEGANITVGTSSGTKIGTATNEKIAFFNATPLSQMNNTTSIDTVIEGFGFRQLGGVSNFASTIKPRTGSTTAGTAPMQFTSGSLLTSPIAGAMEFLTDKPYLTITTGTARKEFTLNDGSLTSGRVPFATTDGRLTDSSAFTFSAGSLSATTFVGALTGNASTATALAANPTDCGAGTKAISIDASGNLTCSAVSLTSDVSGVNPLANGGTNKNLTAVAGGVLWTDADSAEVTAAGSSGQLLQSTGTTAPSWTTATYPSTAGTSANVLVSNGTNFTATTINLASSNAVGSSVLPVANGGTNKALTLSAGGIPYFDADSFEVLAAGSSGQALLSGGTGAPTWGSVLSNPMDSAGDMIYGGTAGVATKLDSGTSQQWLISGGAATPTWGNTVTTGKTIDLGQDEVGLTVQGHSTQTNDILLVEKSDGTDLLNVTNVNGTKIRGTTTNDSAATGFVGEYMELKDITSQNATTTNQYTDCGGSTNGIALGAGDWDISFLVHYSLNSAVCTNLQAGIGTVGANDATGLVSGENTASTLCPTAGTTVHVSIPPWRVSNSGSTTYYGKILAAYTGGPVQFRCKISARRIR